MSAVSPVVGVESPARADVRATSLDISFGVRLTWGHGSLGTISYLNTVSALVLVYLTTVMKVPPDVAGYLVFSARIIDAFSDLV